MDPEIQQMLEERIALLPQRLREYILRPSTKGAIRVIAEKHHITGEKFILFENEVMLVLLGFESLESFDEHIMAELLIPGSAAASIERDLTEMVFTEVRGELEAMAREQEAAEQALEKDPAWSNTSSPTAPPIVPLISKSQPSSTPISKPVADMPRYVKDDPYREPPK